MRPQSKKTASQGSFGGLSPAGAQVWLADELRVVWRAAHQEAIDAYREWRHAPGAVRYATYRAAQDQADAAQDALAEHHR